jgi:hypothetical protein
MGGASSEGLGGWIVQTTNADRRRRCRSGKKICFERERTESRRPHYNFIRKMRNLCLSFEFITPTSHFRACFTELIHKTSKKRGRNCGPFLRLEDANSHLGLLIPIRAPGSQRQPHFHADCISHFGLRIWSAPFQKSTGTAGAS